MIKHFSLAILSLWSVASFAHDESYYSAHPKELQQAFNKCPEQQTTKLSCEQLKAIALRLNTLAYELRLDPQGYGQKILALQEEIAANELTSQHNMQANDSQSVLAKNKKQLKERLAIVKWLESPVS